MELAVEIKEVLFNVEKEQQIERKIEKDKRLIRMIDGLIDSLLDTYCIRDSKDNGTYSKILNGLFYKMSYSTSIEGLQPRYEICLEERIARRDYEGKYFTINHYSYYHGQIYRNTSTGWKNTEDYRNDYYCCLFFMMEIKDTFKPEDVKIREQIEMIIEYLKIRAARYTDPRTMRSVDDL